MGNTPSMPSRVGSFWQMAPLVVPLMMAWASAAPAQGPTVAAPIRGTYRSDRLGLEYRLHPYRGHYGARLTRPPAPGSPLLKLRRPDGSPTYLEPGDMIVGLDDQILDGPDDVEGHVLRTKISFVNVRTGLLERASAMFPDGAAPAVRSAPAPAPPVESAPAPPTVVRSAIRQGESRRVKAILVIDTATKIDALLGNLAIVRAMLAPLVAEGRCDVTVLQGQDATAGKLVEAIRSIGDASSDTVFVYYTGHGATDVGKGHAFTLAQRPVLYRAEVRQELAALRPRLTVLLSECCSALTVIPMSKTAPSPAPQGIPTGDNLGPNVRSLLLRTRGVVDLNSSSCEPSEGLNEYSFVGRTGGLFTGAIGGVLRENPPAKLDKDRDGLLTWGEALPLIRAEVRMAYALMRFGIIRDAENPERPLDDATKDMVEHLRNQPWQSPQAFSLDGPTYLVLTGPGFEPGATFSARAVDDPKFGGEVPGARVDAITDPEAPFGKALKVGDVVTAVNGHTSPTPGLMLERLDSIATWYTIRFWRPADSTFQEVKLPPPHRTDDEAPATPSQPKSIPPPC